MSRTPEPSDSRSSEAEEAEIIARAAEPESPSAGFDIRWLAVAIALTILIAGGLIWIALQAASVPEGADTADHKGAPYGLFQRISHAAEQTFVSWGWADGKQAARKDNPSYIIAHKSTLPPDAEKRTLTLDSGDTLAGILINANIPAAEVHKAVAAMRTVFSPRSLRAGQSFDVVLTPIKPATGDTAPTDAPHAVNDDPEMQLVSLKFAPSVTQEFTLTRTADGAYTATKDVKKLVARQHHAGTKIDSSLYMSALHAGIPAEVVVRMINIFSYKVDFQRDIHPGDSFEVFYTYYYTPAGQPAKVGEISYAKMVLGGKAISLYRYQPDPDSPAGYYDGDGRSAKGILMKTPVPGARITSGFGMRKHPILGYSRMHKGVDFGVPIGTPVMAAGSGVVQFAGWAHGYGRFLLIKHANGLATAYGHLSRFAHGIHRGSHVHQAEVVAFSGMTGMATGPHLHYEIRVHGKKVNPTTFKTGAGRKLTGKERREFLKEREHIDQLISQTHMETKVANAADKTHQKR